MDAKFNYNNNLFQNPSAGDWFSDTFLGTSNTDNKNQNALLNYQMKYNEYMSSTAYQRAMQDMQKAGINPIVAFAGGAKAASTPSAPSAQAPKFDRQGGIIGRATARMVNEFADNLSGKNLREMVPELLGAIF